MLSNLSPVKKLILGLAAMCVAISLITANNLASIMMIIAAKNSAQAPEIKTIYTQSGVQTGTQSGTTGSTGGSTSTGSSGGSSTSTGTGSTSGTTTDANAPAGDATQSGSKTVAETLEIFNKAANGVKTDAKSLKQLNVTNYLAGQATITSGISAVYNLLGGDGWLDGMLKDNSAGEETFTGADIVAKFPVEGENWSSKLTADDVVKAECVENGGVYTITIVTKADAKSDSVKRGEGHAPKAFNVVLPGTVNENIPGPAASLVGLASMDYPESTITATVDVKTGKLQKVEYDSKWTINFDKMGIILPLGTKSAYEITY